MMPFTSLAESSSLPLESCHDVAASENHVVPLLSHLCYHCNHAIMFQRQKFMSEGWHRDPESHIQAATDAGIEYLVNGFDVQVVAAKKIQVARWLWG
jgi:hypothetical protein